MIIAIQIFAALMCLAGLVLLVDPRRVLDPMERNAERIELHYSAVLVRIALGLLLLMTADVSRYPTAIEVLGGLSIAAALVLALIGRRRFVRLMRWALGIAVPLGRPAGLAALAFGGFLLFAYS